MKEDAPFRALHIGDLHFWDIPASPFAYMGKRLLGVGNLIIGRRAKRFRTSMGHLLSEKLGDLDPCPDTLLFSGDFSSTSLPTEFRQANELLRDVVTKCPGKGHFVPGNHDCYTRRSLSTLPFQQTLDDSFKPETSVSFHDLAEGAITLLRINATTSNGLLGCHGAISEQARAAIQAGLKNVQSPHLWILCHFPPEEPKAILRHDRGQQLQGAERLLQGLAAHPSRKLWLHGHHHQRWLYSSPTVAGLTYVNAGAPFLVHKKQLPDLGFHELILEGDDVRIRTHVLGQEGNRWLVLDPELPERGKWVDLQKESL